MKRTKLIVAGHLCIDITPPFQCDQCSRLEEVLSPGKLIQVGAAEIHPGGIVTNSGLAMKFFGADVVLMGKVGDDAFGRMLVDIYKGYHAESGMIVDRESDTSYTVVIAVPGVDRVFLHHSGANDTFSESDVDYAACEEAVVFHFGYPPLMRKMYLDGGAELTEMYRKVKQTGCLTSLDMAAVDDASEAGTADWKTLLRNTLPYTDLFLPSIEEILYMLDREHYDALQRLADGRDVTEVLDIERDLRPTAQKLLDMGCKVVLLKCGASGLYYRTAGEERIWEMREVSGLSLPGFDDQEGFEKSYVPDAVISGTGCGDTTIAAFLTAMTRDYPFDMCVKLAAAAGACCVAAVDSLSGLKPFAEMEKRIREGWKKNS